MNNIIFTEFLQDSHIECEEYIPLRVVFDTSIENNRFIGFYNGENNLIEFSVSNQTNMIKKFQVVSCKDYQIIRDNILLPESIKNGSIQISYPPHNECETFLMSVYKNGIKINISRNNASLFYAVGQIIFCLDNNKQLVSLIIKDLSANEIAHTLSELQSE